MVDQASCVSLLKGIETERRGICVCALSVRERVYACVCVCVYLQICKYKFDVEKRVLISFGRSDRGFVMITLERKE